MSEPIHPSVRTGGRGAILARELARLFEVFEVEPGEEAARAHHGAASRAMTGEADQDVEVIMQAAVATLCDTWRPTAWRRYPVPAEVRGAILDARRARQSALTETRHALPMTDEERQEQRAEAQHMLDELAGKLGWPADWREDARKGDRERIAGQVKALIAEAERERSAGRGDAGAPGKRRRRGR